MTIETKSILVTGPEMSAVLATHEAQGWRCTSMDCIGAADYELHLCRTLEAQGELPIVEGQP